MFGSGNYTCNPNPRRCNDAETVAVQNPATSCLARELLSQSGAKTMNISIGGSLVSDKAEPLLAEIRELAPAISARVAEIEAGRRLPLHLVATLRSIGVFRMFAPQSHGGLELDLPAADRAPARHGSEVRKIGRAHV